MTHTLGFCLDGQRLSGPLKWRLWLITLDERRIEIPFDEEEQCYLIPETGEVIFEMEHT